jgi:DNA-binding transcriptional ArsR family regulator
VTAKQHQRTERTLTDPRAIRALAHPARLTVLEALSDGVELTATACAELAHSSPSAMSYHLRALEKYGFVERVESGGDGRERPWRAVASGWRVDDMPDAATAMAAGAVTKVSFDRTLDALDRWFHHESEQPQEWRDATVVSNSRVWLTAEEVVELQRLNDGFLDQRRGRTEHEHPDGARRIEISRTTVPLQLD